MSAEIQAVRIFIAYSSQDLSYKEEIRKRLKPLVRAGKVTVWDNYDIEGGADWDAEIREKLEESDLILLLLSPDALDSDYFYEVEVPIALRRHKAGEALAVGVLLRPCALKHTPFEFAQYELLPKKGYPVTDPQWPHVDAAYLTIFEEIDLLVEKLERLRTERMQLHEDAVVIAKENKKKQHKEATLPAKKAVEHEQTRHSTDGSRQGREDKNDDPFADLMVYVKGGTFDMGDSLKGGIYQSIENAIFHYDEKPVHRVTVKDFYLCKYPVTQAQWKAIMGHNPSDFKGDDLPVEQVSWKDAQAFLKKLNEMLPARQMQYRLPTEAEWEYAARGGTQSKKFRYAGSDNLYEVAWHGGNSASKTHPVGQKKPNELGLFDMSGNVWEWCEDWYDSKFYKKCTAKGTVENPKNDEKGSSRVLRGGSWLLIPQFCRVASRGHVNPEACHNHRGFRLAASLPSQ